MDRCRCYRGTNDESSDIRDGRSLIGDLSRSLVDRIRNGFTDDGDRFFTGDILDLFDTDRPALPSSSSRVLHPIISPVLVFRVNTAARAHLSHPALWAHPFPLVIAITPAIHIRRRVQIGTRHRHRRLR